jgi:hypothetical protein
MKFFFLIFFSVFSFSLSSQDIGDSKKTIIKSIKKRPRKDSICVGKTSVKVYSALNKTEYDLYLLDSLDACDTIIQGGPIRGVDFYKQTYSISMHKQDDSTWIKDEGRVRRTVKLVTDNDEFRFYITEEVRGFIRK